MTANRPTISASVCPVPFPGGYEARAAGGIPIPSRQVWRVRP